MIPLPDLGKGKYQGYQGGLYPNGENERPFAHNQAGIAIAQSLQPLNANGEVDVENGKIGFLSIGMSNTSMEFTQFISRTNELPEKNPNLVIVDGAQRTKAAQYVANPADGFWVVLDERISDAGLTNNQIEVIWLKETLAYPNQDFPNDAWVLMQGLKTIVHLLADRFPNLQMVYLSSRTYGGYATTGLNPEPYAYQSGFAVKWLIESQIYDDPSLNYDPALGEVTAPWLSWGPYLWANGTEPNSRGIVWQYHEFTYDGTHPSPAGEAKVAGLLYHFLRTDETAVYWFLR